MTEPAGPKPPEPTTEELTRAFVAEVDNLLARIVLPDRVADEAFERAWKARERLLRRLER